MYLGLDFGTSSVKGVLIDAKQKIVATASAPLKVSRPQPGWSEQNPEDWWKACNIVVKTLGKMKPKAVAAVEGICARRSCGTMPAPSGSARTS